MKKNNKLAGLVLIFLGMAYFLQNFHISMMSTIITGLGAYFLYSAVVKKYQPHYMFGVILAATGAIMLLRDLKLFRFDISGEVFLAALGVIFLLFYFRKGILGFVFPGYILPAIAIYSMLENNINDGYIWPGFFILLGLAFYMIYFTAFAHISSWPLIPGTILILFGLGAFAVIFGIVSLDMVKGLLDYKNYILPAVIILIGFAILLRSFRK